MNKLPGFIINWYANRKITESTLAAFNIGWDGNRIVIPIYNEQGKLLFRKYRRSPLVETGNKYMYDKGGSLALFAADKIKNEKTVMWVEGEGDAMACWAHNIPAVSSTGGAQSISQEWKNLLAGKEIIICFDNDLPGGQGMAKAFDLIPEAKLLFLPDRPGVKDISDMVANGGDLHKLLKSAKQFKNIEEIIEERDKRVALWQSTWFFDAYIQNHTEKEQEKAPRFNKKDGDDLAKAKQYPIDKLLKFNGLGKTICPFHNEDHASLHYYRKQNRAYCFGGCGRGYDAIDIYIKQNNCSFQEAIKFLAK